MGWEKLEEPVLDGKMATELLALVTRDLMVTKDATWSTHKGQSLPARLSLRMGCQKPTEEETKLVCWQAFPSADEGGTTSHPVELVPSWKESRTE